jgi:cellulose synthase operon protein C
MRVACPHCQASYNVDDRRIPVSGLNVRCPKCQNAFPVRKAAEGSRVASTAVPLPAPAPARKPEGQGAVPLSGLEAAAIPSPLAPPPAAPVIAPPPPRAAGLDLAADGPAVPLPEPSGGGPLPAPPPQESLGFGEVSLESPEAPPPIPPPQAEAEEVVSFAEPKAAAEAARPAAAGPGALGPAEEEELEMLFGEGSDSGPTAVAVSEPPASAAPRRGGYKVRRRSGKVFGPFEAAQIVEMLGKGELLGNEEVSSDGGKTWAGVGSAPAFADSLRKLSEPPATPEPARKRIPAPFAGRMAPGKVAERATPRRRWIPLAVAGGVLVAALGAGLAGGLTRHGLFFHKLVRGRRAASGPAAQLVGRSHAALAEDRFDAATRARDLAEEALRLDGEDPEARSAHVQAVAWLAPRGGAPEAVLARARQELADLEKQEAGERATLEAALAFSVDAAPEKRAAASAAMARMASKGPAGAGQLFLLAEVAAASGDAAGAGEWLAKLDAVEPGSARGNHVRGLLAARRGEGKAAAALFAKAMEKDPRHASSALELAALVDRGVDPSRAEALLRGLLVPEAAPRLGPVERARAHAQLADLVLRHGGPDEARHREAEREFEEALREDPTGVPARLAYARHLLGRGAAERAVQALAPVAGASAKDAELFALNARALVLAGRALDAKNAVDSALLKSPQSEPLVFLKGFVVEQLGKPDEARALYEKAAAQDPSDFAPHLGLGRLALKSGDLARAGAEIALAVEKGPRQPDAQTALGDWKIARRDPAGAEAAYRAALSLDPDHARAHAGLARVALERGDSAGARRELERALALDPRLGEAQVSLGMLLWKAGDPEGAKKAFQAAVALDPRGALARTRLGAVELEQKQVEAGLKDLAQATDADPGSAEAQFWYGRALLARNDTGQAVERLKRAVDLDPQNALHHLYLGIAREQAGALPEARDAYLAAVARDPRLTEGWERVGLLLASQGLFAEAVPNFEKALATSPRNQRFRVEIGDSKEKLGKHAEAIRAYREALKGDPSQVGLYYRIARAIHEGSGAREALPWYERAAREDRKNPMPHYYLGHAYKERRQRSRAIQEFRSYLKLRPDADDRKDIEQEIEDLGG